jgi:hypothetical protein
MLEELDPVARYGMSLGFTVRHRTVLVEGNTDVELFHLASHLECKATGIELLGQSLAIVSPGTGDLGGTWGVIRELVSLRATARTCLFPDGRPRYRFIGLFDTDRAGRQAVRDAHEIDTSILEYKDVFRLHPVMPANGILHPKSLKASFERENAAYKGLEWESEDILPSAFIDEFLSEYPDAVRRKVDIGGGKIHRDFTQDGKARFHRFIRDHAMRVDLVGVVDVLKALRFYCGLK